jgi:hypothetical protein
MDWGGGGEKNTEEEKANEEERGKEGDWHKFSVHTNVSPWGERLSKLKISTQSRNSIRGVRLHQSLQINVQNTVLWHSVAHHLFIPDNHSRLTCSSLFKTFRGFKS